MTLELFDTPEDEHLDAMMLGNWSTSKEGVVSSKYNGNIYLLKAHRHYPVLPNISASYGVVSVRPEMLANVTA